MDNTKHTATPWKLSKNGDVETIRIFCKNGYEVCRASDLPSVFGNNRYGDGGTKEQEANAEFIVRACNSHDALVEACQEMFEELLSQQYNPTSKIMKKWKQALKQAEGE